MTSAPSRGASYALCNDHRTADDDDDDDDDDADGGDDDGDDDGEVGEE